jgi:hypothetical protein
MSIENQDMTQISVVLKPFLDTDLRGRTRMDTDSTSRKDTKPQRQDVSLFVIFVASCEIKSFWCRDLCRLPGLLALCSRDGGEAAYSQVSRASVLENPAV